MQHETALSIIQMVENIICMSVLQALKTT